jgi:opacity protein-like surface antigen
MKKILLSSVIAAAALTPVAAGSFSGMFTAAKGSILIFHKGALPDLTKNQLDTTTKDYSSFGFNGGAGGVEFGYSFRFVNNFVMGLSLGCGYKHHTITEARDTEAGTDKKALGLEFVTSGLTAEARARFGMVYKRFHIYLNPGVELSMANPELTVNYKGDGDKDTSLKITYAADKAPDWKQRLSFVLSLNVEYALTQTMFVGGGVGYRYSFADVKDQKANFSEDTNKSNETAKIVNDIAYKNPYGVEAGIVVGANF